MPCIAYEDKRLNPEYLYMIDQINAICVEYAEQGYDLTLRQLYYQFVARDAFPPGHTWRRLGNGKWVRDENGTINADPNYKWLGDIVSAGRMAGLIDWDFIVDRTRNLRGLKHWNSPSDACTELSKNFRYESWKDQPYYIEVWIEKDALVGVLESACQPLDVNYFSCRGYTSISEVWGAAQRLRSKMEDGKKVVVLHLGDHDPSGVDMTRDISERLYTFIAHDLRDGRGEMPRMSTAAAIQYTDDHFLVDRIALTMAQVQAFNPPPNPAKPKDARYKKYVRQFGVECWELDALSPDVLVNLIQQNILALRDDEKWEAWMTKQRKARKVLKRVADRWLDVVKFFDFLDKKGK